MTDTRIPYRPDETFEVNDRVRYEFPSGTRWEGVVEEVTADRTDSNYPMYSIRKRSGEKTLLAAGYLTKIGVEEIEVGDRVWCYANGEGVVQEIGGTTCYVNYDNSDGDRIPCNPQHLELRSKEVNEVEEAVSSYSPGDKVKVVATPDRLRGQSIPNDAALRLIGAEYVIVRRAGDSWVEVDDPDDPGSTTANPRTWYMASRGVAPYTEGDPVSSTDRAFRVGDVVEHKSWGWRGEITNIEGTWCDIRITRDASEGRAVVGEEHTAPGENLKLVQAVNDSATPAYPSNFHEWKLNVATEALRLADEHDMCDTVENFLREHDFPIPKSTTTLRVEIVLESVDRIELKDTIDSIAVRARSLKLEYPEIQSVVIDEDDD